MASLREKCSQNGKLLLHYSCNVQQKYSMCMFMVITLFFFILACIRGTYKQWATPTQCLPCPENSTTADVGSILKDQCYCWTGYEGDPKRDIACTRNYLTLAGSMLLESFQLSVKNNSLIFFVLYFNAM